jgi:hypothetical protein
MGKSTISMAMFNSYVSLPEGIIYHHFSNVLDLNQLVMEGSSRAQCYVVQANSGLEEENEDDLR